MNIYPSIQAICISLGGAVETSMMIEILLAVIRIFRIKSSSASIMRLQKLFSLTFGFSLLLKISIL